jgi:hypothetical protein
VTPVCCPKDCPSYDRLRNGCAHHGCAPTGCVFALRAALESAEQRAEDAELQCSSPVSLRDLTIRDLRAALAESERERGRLREVLRPLASYDAQPTPCCGLCHCLVEDCESERGATACYGITLRAALESAEQRAEEAEEKLLVNGQLARGGSSPASPLARQGGGKEKL